MDLTDLRPAILFVHVLAAFGFVLSHGVAVFVGFALRADPDPSRLRPLLELSHAAFPMLYVTLLVALITGILGAVIAGQFGQLWPWLSIGVVVATFVAMYVLASGPLADVREAIGMRSFRTKKDEPDPTPAGPEVIAARVAAFRPEAVAVIGVVSLVALIWLMRFRPF
jgi:hypothetical protein